MCDYLINILVRCLCFVSLLTIVMGHLTWAIIRWILLLTDLNRGSISPLYLHVRSQLMCCGIPFITAEVPSNMFSFLLKWLYFLPCISMNKNKLTRFYKRNYQSYIQTREISKTNFKILHLNCSVLHNIKLNNWTSLFPKQPSISNT